MLHTGVSFVSLWLLAAILFLDVVAYVPASPTNVTEDAIAAGLNVTDVSKLHLQWFPNGRVFSPIGEVNSLDSHLQVGYATCLVSIGWIGGPRD